MFRWFKEREAKRLAQAELETRETTARLEYKIAQSKDEMLTRPCAINGMRNCEERCVHFRNGFVSAVPHINGGLAQWIEYPKCKLWRCC